MLPVEGGNRGQRGEIGKRSQEFASDVVLSGRLLGFNAVRRAMRPGSRRSGRWRQKEGVAEEMATKETEDELARWEPRLDCVVLLQRRVDWYNLTQKGNVWAQDLREYVDEW